MKISRIISIILVIVILVVPELSVNAASIKTSQLITNNTSFSTWLWNTSEIVNNSDGIISFLAKNNVKVIYLQVDYSLNYTYYKNFISKASKNKIAVHALDGSSDWVSSNGTTIQNKFFDWLTNYQKASSVAEKFKGVHLDVEPYSNSEYSTNPNKIITRYQDFILNSKNNCKKLNLDLGIDIPFWFNEVKYNTSYGSGNLAEWIFKNIKIVTIMAYRDTASGSNGISKIAEAEMNLCKKSNVKATIAVETGNVPETRFITFFEEGQAYMYSELNSVYLNYRKNSSFNGFAIHYLDSWMNMKR